MSDPLKMLILCGSLNDPSHTFSLCNSIQSKLEERDVNVTLWDFYEQTLPFADPKFHHDPMNENNDPEVKKFIHEVVAADAIIWSTPIYHNSYSGVLKNALDHLSIPLLMNKVVGLVSHGGNRSPQALDHLRIVARSLHAHTIPSQVCSASQDFEASEDGYVLIADSIFTRIEKFCEEIIVFSKMLKIIRSQ